MKKTWWLVLVIPMMLLMAVASAEGIGDAEAAFERGQYAEAFRIYHSLAVSNDPVAQDAVGTMYMLGVGVEQDLVLGAMWLALAAANGNEDSRETLLDFVRQNRRAIIEELDKDARAPMASR